MAGKGLAARLAMFEEKEEEAKVFNAKNKVSGSSASKPIVLKERVDANDNSSPYYQRMMEQQQKKEESSAQQQPTHEIEPAAALPLAQAQPISSEPSEPPPSQPQPQPLAQASPIATTRTAKNGSNGSSNSLQSRIAMFGGLQTAQNIVAAPADPKTNALHEIEKMRKYEQETARKVEQDKLAQQQREEEAAKQVHVQVANEAAEVERQQALERKQREERDRKQREERERAAAKEREDQRREREQRERELQVQRERQELEKQQQQQQEQRAKQEQEQRLQREQAEKEKEKEQEKAEQARLAAIQQQQQREQLEREQLQREQVEKEQEQEKEKAEQARLEQQQQLKEKQQKEKQEADRLRLQQQRQKSDEADKSRQQKLEDSLRRLEERKKQQSQPQPQSNPSTTIPATTSTNNIAPASNISTSTPATATAKVVLATAKQPFAPPIETTSDVDEDEPMKQKQKLKKQTTPMDVLVASGLFTDGDGGGVEPLHIQDESDDEHADKQQFKSKRRKSKSKESKHPKKQYPSSTRVNKSMAWDETDDANMGGKRVKTMKSQSDDIKDAFDDKHSTPDITLADARKLKMNQFHNDPAMRTKLKAMKNLSGGGFKIHVNYRYIIDDGRIGVCKFKGRTAFGKSSEDWIGIKVEHGQGVNNGTVSGKTYFRCRDGQGVMVKAERILIELGHETKVAIDAQTIGKAKELSEAYALVQEEKLKERQRKQKKSKEWKTDDEYAGWLPPKWDDFEEDHADNLFGQKLHYSKTLLDKYKGQKVEKKKHHTEV